MLKFKPNPISWFLMLATCELFSSWWLWGSIPTDTVATYYPTAWSYIGEHFLIWLIFLAVLTILLKLTLRREFWMRAFGLWHCTLVIGAAIVLEFLSSSYRWYLGLQDGSRFPWWRGGFGTYLAARLVPLLISLAFGSAMMIWRSRAHGSSRTSNVMS
jgi:hypothetical protein